MLNMSLYMKFKEWYYCNIDENPAELKYWRYVSSILIVYWMEVDVLPQCYGKSND